jgi:hypothetical protein
MISLLKNSPNLNKMKRMSTLIQLRVETTKIVKNSFLLLPPGANVIKQYLGILPW